MVICLGYVGLPEGNGDFFMLISGDLMDLMDSKPINHEDCLCEECEKKTGCFMIFKWDYVLFWWDCIHQTMGIII